MALFDTFDDASEEILQPSHMAQRIDGFPENVLVTFRGEILHWLLENYKTEVAGRMHAGLEIPVYKTEHKGTPIAFFMTWVGGPATVGLLEHVIAMGGRNILLFGSCGSLDKTITDGHIVVPTAAYRDEGTSYHYAPPSDFMEVKTANRLYEILSELKVPAICGKTWTTDAFFRETRRNTALRKQAGCITVEMECASVMALARFRNVEAYQFLYTADNLDCTAWEPRILGNMPDDMAAKYARIALEVAIRL